MRQPLRVGRSVVTHLQKVPEVLPHGAPDHLDVPEEIATGGSAYSHRESQGLTTMDQVFVRLLEAEV